MHSGFQPTPEFEREIESRLGLVPNLFRSAPAAPEVRRRLWIETVAEFLDNPLPASFKQRLFVYLSRLSTPRYCLVRHAGYLMGHGRVAGDPAAPPQSREDLMALLRYPLPERDALEDAIRSLQAAPGAQQALPAMDTPLEQAVFVGCGALYRNAQHSAIVRDLLYHVLGRQWSEQTFLLVGHAVKTHFWVSLHPEIAIEADMRAALELDPELAQLLLEPQRTPQPAPPQQPQADSASTNVPATTAINADLMRMLNHELRTPVAAISAVSDMLQMVAGADERLRNACQVLQRQVGAMTRIMDGVLDLSELASGALLLEAAPTAVDAALRAAMAELAARIENRKLGIDIESSAEAAMVWADPARLRQMFECLLGHILTRCKTGSLLRVTLSAQGEKLKLRMLLEPPSGMRLSQATTGLALAKTIAEKGGGSLEPLAESDGQAGYVLSLPQPKTPAAVEDSRSAKLRVLCIEDNRDFAQLFQHMLQILGCELEISADAETGLQMARTMSPQLIFCDIGLPGDMDGYDFARSLRADAQLAHVPLVAVSAYCSPADVKVAHEAGFDRVCGKPVKFADISAALDAFAAGTLRTG